MEFKTKIKRGPKSNYSKKLAELICHRVASGENLDAIGVSDGMPPVGTLRNWLDKNKRVYKREFATMYQDARKKREALTEEAPCSRKPHVKFSNHLMVEICEQIAQGQTLIKVCKNPNMPNYSTVRSWLQPFSKTYKKEFAEAYSQACDIKADWFFDKIEELIDDVGYERDEISQARFKLDAMQIAASRNAPKRFAYRSKIEFNEHETPDDQQENKRDTHKELQEIFQNPELREAYAKIALHQLEQEKDERNG